MPQPKNPVMKLLLGHWLGHPLHPAIVHVPIALWVGSLFFDILNLCHVQGNNLVRASFWAILLGLIGAGLAIPPGIAEWTQIKRDRPAWKLALWHMILNVTTVALFLISLLLRARHLDAQTVSIAPFVLVVVGDAVLMVSGYLGGRMVYNYGIGVARMSKGKWRQIAAAGKANLPQET